MAGFAHVSIKDKDLEPYRTGYSPANPAGAQAMVREIDRLRDRLLDVELLHPGSIDGIPHGCGVRVGTLTQFFDEAGAAENLVNAIKGLLRVPGDEK